jgi:hypothetical protein
MRLIFSQQTDGKILVWGRYKDAEYSFQIRQFVAPENSFFGLTWGELSALSWIETNDDGAITHKEPRIESVEIHSNTGRPSFLRDVT